MRRIAYLTMADADDVAIDYEASFPAMRERGFEPVVQPWREPGVDWDAFAAVYLSTPWDYPEHLAEFRGLLARIDASAAILVNPLELVRWNLEKTYLRELAARGASIVPTLWRDSFDASELPAWFARFGADSIVVKPVVGANAAHTYVIDRTAAAAFVRQLEAVFATRPFCVQPFVDRIRVDGEYSLFFFGAEYSHAIRKQPRAGDFRTQEQYGARIEPHTATAGMIETAQRVVAMLDPQPVYARIDFVRDSDDHCLLMEVELIEPSLYFRSDADAAGRFAAAIDDYLEERTND